LSAHLLDDAEVQLQRKVAEERDRLAGADFAEDVREELGVRGARIGGRAEDPLVVELAREPHLEPRRRRLLALHRIRHEQRLAIDELDRIPARHLRAAREPPKRRMHGLVHRHDQHFDRALAHEGVEIAEHAEW
jgi:hypothetical protein